MQNNNKIDQLPFDQFSRQTIVKKIIESNREKTRYKILDVGGYKGNTNLFYPNDDVTVADLFDIKEKGYVKVDGKTLPFDKESFDIVVSFDTLEHVKSTARENFLNDLIRVSANLVVVVAPFNTSNVSATEKKVNNFYKNLNGKNHQWLDEHIKFGVPDTKMIQGIVSKRQYKSSIVSTNYLPLWAAMQKFIFIFDAVGLPELTVDANTFYNQNLMKLGEGLEPSYRKIVTIKKEGTLNGLDYNGQLDGRCYFELGSIIDSAFLAMAKHDLTYAKHLSGLVESLNAKTDHLVTELENKNQELQRIYNSRAWKALAATRKIVRRK